LRFFFFFFFTFDYIYYGHWNQTLPPCMYLEMTEKPLIGSHLLFPLKDGAHLVHICGRASGGVVVFCFGFLPPPPRNLESGRQNCLVN